MYEHIYWTAFIIISLTILRSQGFKSLCDSIQVFNGSSSKITCDFEDDITKHQLNIYVEHVHADLIANPYSVMSCRWKNGNFDCEVSLGYQFDSNWTSTSISVIIPETLPHHAGQYWCEVMSSDASHNTRCQLVVLPTGVYTDSMSSTVTAGSTSSENNALFKGVTSFCKVVMNGHNATLTCCFDSDIGALQRNLYVNRESKHGVESVLSCRWKGGNHYCESRSGYKMISNISNTVTVEILNVDDEHAGEYWCEVLPSQPATHKRCLLIVTDVHFSSDSSSVVNYNTSVRRRSVTSPYQTTTPPRTESDKSSSKTSSYNEVDDLELTARIREEADSVEYTRPSPPTAHAHSTRTALSSHAERLIAVPQEAVTIEQAARAQQPEYVEIENEVRPNGDDGYLVPAGQYASLNPATRSEEGHEYENLGSRPTESSSTPGYSGLVKSTKREKHLYDRLRRETNQTIEAEEEDPTYAIALEQMPGPTFTKL